MIRLSKLYPTILRQTTLQMIRYSSLIVTFRPSHCCFLFLFSYRQWIIFAVYRASHIYWLLKNCSGSHQCNSYICIAQEPWGTCSPEIEFTWWNELQCFLHHFSLQVVYAILHRQEVFEPFKNHPRFNELLENIYTVRVLFIIHEFAWVLHAKVQVLIIRFRPSSMIV